MEIVTAFLVNIAVPGAGLIWFMRIERRMRDEAMPFPLVLAVFILFATYGAWLVLILTFFFWYWSGMASAGLAYLILAAPIVTLIIGGLLLRQRRTSPYHSGAFWASAAYIPFLLFLLGIHELLMWTIWAP